ncbi:hypothetical protein BJY16_007047 [Actinoplanes octamycinicus]|uniref:Uncharacterized protein n=1 Tax=Actinoplanes octamycinicus TaxID=135948 RepID=A0A7W7H456_9ACTN|nr:hypothetical protein [Actinoplanes octamycinicus]MBB4743588.1 hypothetical protein [Actinoplanes octamycinicus]GIE61013.1 hypothetical protein Aoc01nite_64150 [Actinoplanes octamycinicus]
MITGERMADDERIGTSYGWTVAVGLGWYATVISAWLVGRFQVDDPHACDGQFGTWCMTSAHAGIFWLSVASPVLLVMVVVMLLIARPISRNVPAPPLAGTLAAAASGAVVACLGGAWLVLR